MGEEQAEQKKPPSTFQASVGCLRISNDEKSCKRNLSVELRIKVKCTLLVDTQQMCAALICSACESEEKRHIKGSIYVLHELGEHLK